MLGPSIEQFLSSKAHSKKGAKKVKEQEESTSSAVPKCIGLLVSIVKVYLEATLVGQEDAKILSLIKNSATTPFKFQSHIDAKDFASKLQADLEMGPELGGEAQDLLNTSLEINNGTPKF